jgi:cobaltochelatase CobT
LRDQLDIKLKKLNGISNHLTGKLKRKLLAKKNVTHEYNKEDGMLDRKKMTQAITRPFSGNNYMVINEYNYQDTVVCLLLDNSGSMRGNPITMSAMACELIAKILEKFGIKTEILGFTTVDWRGGKSRKLWESSGKPSNPGRLSDLRHIIYKNANQSFKKSRVNLGLMLKEGILKENIDGEALIWAKKRLDARNEQRKILMIISDGTPVDDSTNSNNQNDILSNHLHHVIAKIEKHSDIEITAIGIGHDVKSFYKNSLTISNIDDLGDVMIDRICQLL